MRKKNFIFKLPLFFSNILERSLFAILFNNALFILLKKLRLIEFGKNCKFLNVCSILLVYNSLHLYFFHFSQKCQIKNILSFLFFLFFLYHINHFLLLFKQIFHNYNHLPNKLPLFWTRSRDICISKVIMHEELCPNQTYYLFWNVVSWEAN
jgi:hypothetical protein